MSLLHVFLKIIIDDLPLSWIPVPCYLLWYQTCSSELLCKMKAIR